MKSYDRFEKSFNDVFNLGIEHLQLGFLKDDKRNRYEKFGKKYGYKYKDYHHMKYYLMILSLMIKY